MVLNLKAVFYTLGMLVFFLGAALIIPMLVALFYGEAEWWAFGFTALISLFIGAVSWFYKEKANQELQIRDGFAIVALAWLVLSLIGALPFVFGGVLASYTDAFFETMSAFTTTGATIFGGAGNMDIESMPRSFMLWRSLAHWMGGMGIIVLTLAILPLLGVGGM